MLTLNAKNLTLGQVHQLFNFQKQYNNSFTSLLSLELLTEFEQQELLQIRDDFDNYLSNDRVSEGLVKALTTFPLMRLAGFYRHPINISLEQDIADILIEDEDITITGRLDILAINKTKPITNEIFFWVLVIETKNSLIDPLAGLPQLLTYTSKSIERQASVWGLTTNGSRYQFVYIQHGNPAIYQLMPLLNLMEPESSILLLQVLKAICKL
ncbi:restriction endonuclease subunit R [Kamptonema animale CS-326]|jgi:hypothetical protein|uniref:restriction endonuclease subunit R n=1 Tax=Kamptonema animale TaxID=92934 RepID=UPI00232AFDB8|nr:restriction endonuclease subunit R [Kamptonema animale]MDB9510949.1 restriction endonuclease subunit R [Kamptonema animale CS-326]